ncbi:MAG TPA: hypothetical protein VHG09_11800, partial [Longimicrobiales bacterium]|nr:hypothetical protein [Longimicrobiales bacterium]
MRRICFSIVLLALAVPPASAQRSTMPPTAADSAAAFANEGTASLFGRARDARQRTDSAILSYTAIVRSRMAAGMRMPLKDRTLFRSETASRVRWSRHAPHVVQTLAAREQTPGGVEVPDGLAVGELFDPSESDRLYFGFGGDDDDGDDEAEERDSTEEQDSTAARDTQAAADSTEEDDDEISFWIEHPLGDAAERHYRYATGDTLTIRLQDGRVVRVVELRVTPRRDDPHTVRGTLWIDAASGALVQAAFRLARTVDILHDFEWSDEEDLDDMDMVPGFLKPFEFDVSLVTVEYSLWEMSHWLPRTMRTEGMARAGVLKFPASFEVGYEMQDVVIEGDSATEAAAAR